MRKLFCCFFILCFLPILACAQETEVTGVSAKIEQDTIVISGSITSGEGQRVSVTITSPKGKMYFIDNVISEEGGSFSFTSGLYEKEGGVYQIAIGGYGVGTPVQTSVTRNLSSENQMLDFSIGNDRGTINGNSIYVTVRSGELSNRKATFHVSEKAEVYVNNQLQESGVNIQDFTSNVIYEVRAEDNSIRKYTVIAKEYSSGGSGGSGGSSSGGKPSNGGSYIVPPSQNNNDKNPVTPNETEKTTFGDLDSVPWAKEAILALAEDGILSGVSPERFEPERNITREEFAAVLLRTAGIEPSQGEVPFADVAEDQWYTGYIAAAAEQNIVTGMNETEFGVGQAITRQDLAVMVYRAFEEKIRPVRPGSDFADSARIADYALEAVKALQSGGIINGKDGYRFDPQANATRAEVAVIAATLRELE